ncbi:MAG: class I SAM-dependent methyltransferase [Chlorobiales bacterium]|nr:class I SAM-dependent methyltransferase [Chlorobiales bacterium]
MTKQFKDRFSNHASEYRLYRPLYPEALFNHLASLAPTREAAWDCATGNGQSATCLARLFKQVYATDASSKQITHAIQKPNIDYSVSPAHRTALPDHSIDLITVAQAIHWFDNEPFYREVRRVIKKGGVIAAWAYHLPVIDPEIDRIIQRLYSEILGPFWEKEISHVASGYRDLYFPFKTLQSPVFTMKTNWNLYGLIGYLQTWSALEPYRKRYGNSPVERIVPDLLAVWETPSSSKQVFWPIILKTGTSRQAC